MKSRNLLLTSILFSVSLSVSAQTNTYPFPDSGNVGIGTTSPESALSIRGYTLPDSNIWGADHTLLFNNGSLGNNGSHGLWLKWNVYREAGATNTHRYLDYQDQSNAAQMLFSQTGIGFSTAEFTGNLDDQISLSNRLMIKANGNVGVGTSNPIRRFHVGYDDVSYAAYGFFDGQWSTDYKKHARLEFNDKNFGIGAGKISTSSGDDDLYLWSYAGAGKDIRFMSTTNAESSVDSWNSNMIIQGNTGYVGIGTTTPYYQLHIRKDTTDRLLMLESSSPWGTLIQLNSKGTGGRKYSILSAAQSAAQAGDGYFAIIDETSAYQTRFVISPTGNVGIGTTSPENKLDVNGTVRAKEIIVESNWSDFVFEDDYQLKSLTEVEEHINQHGHLPDVPSAQTIQSEGLSVGASQTIMMQKIEELTLYVIELKKQNDSLQIQIKELSSH